MCALLGSWSSIGLAGEANADPDVREENLPETQGLASQYFDNVTRERQGVVRSVAAVGDVPEELREDFVAQLDFAVGDVYDASDVEFDILLQDMVSPLEVDGIEIKEEDFGVHIRIVVSLKVTIGSIRFEYSENIEALSRDDEDALRVEFREQVDTRETRARLLQEIRALAMNSEDSPLVFEIRSDPMMGEGALIVDVQGHTPKRLSEIRIDHDTTMTRRALMRLLAVNEGEDFKRPEFLGGVERLHRRLASSGYRHARVKWGLKKKDKHALLQVDIRVGIKTSLRFNFTRASGFESLRRRIGTWYSENPDAGRHALEKITRKELQREGYLYARVKIDEVFLREDTSSIETPYRPQSSDRRHKRPRVHQIVLNIDAGERVFIQDVVLTQMNPTIEASTRAQVRQWLSEFAPKSGPRPSPNLRARHPHNKNLAFHRGDSSEGAEVLCVYNEAYVKRVRTGLERWLRTQGYLQAQVTRLANQFTKGPEYATLAFRVESGPRFFLASLIALPDMSERYPALVLPPSQEKGVPLNPLSVESARAGYEKGLRDLGYFNAKVRDLWFIDDDRHVDIRLSVVTGPKVRVGRIFFRGHERTKSWVLEERMKIQEGDLLVPGAVDASRRSLLRSALFQRVEIEIRNLSASPNIKDLIVRLKERSAFQLELGGGASIEDGPRGFIELEAKNPLGLALYSRTRLQVNYPRATFGLVYAEDDPNHPRDRFDQIDPSVRPFYFFEGQATQEIGWEEIPNWDLETRLHLDLGAQRAIRSAFNLLQASIALGVDFNPFEWWFASASVGRNWSDFDCPDVGVGGQSTCGLTQALRRTDTGYIAQYVVSTTQRFSFLDEPNLPHKGFVLNATTALALGEGSIESPDGPAQSVKPNYVRVDLDTKTYLPLSTHTVFALNLRLGHIFPIGDLSNWYVPLFDRNYLGGTGSLRGFFQDAILPVDTEGWPSGQANPGSGYEFLSDTRTSLGGNSMLLARLELRFLLSQDLAFAPFTDFGQLALDTRSFRLDSMSVSTGVGLRYRSPIGPLAVDLGYQLYDGGRALSQVLGLGRMNLHFSIGY